MVIFIKNSTSQVISQPVVKGVGERPSAGPYGPLSPTPKLENASPASRKKGGLGETGIWGIVRRKCKKRWNCYLKRAFEVNRKIFKNIKAQNIEVFFYYTLDQKGLLLKNCSLF